MVPLVLQRHTELLTFTFAKHREKKLVNAGMLISYNLPGKETTDYSNDPLRKHHVRSIFCSRDGAAARSGMWRRKMAATVKDERKDT